VKLDDRNKAALPQIGGKRVALIVARFYSDLADQLAGGRLGLQHDRHLGRRQHVADCSEDTRRLLHTSDEVSGRRRQSCDKKIPEGVARELTGRKTMLERLAQR